MEKRVGKRSGKREPLETADSSSLAKSFVWGAVILAAFIGVLFFAYQVQRQIRPPEYEGKIIDKWAGYSHSEKGSFPYFSLLVETAGGQRSTVAVDQQTYDRAKVGMRIRKTKAGIELSSLTPSPHSPKEAHLSLRLRKTQPSLAFTLLNSKALLVLGILSRTVCTERCGEWKNTLRISRTTFTGPQGDPQPHSYREEFAKTRDPG
jgi:hypothetical protein